MLDVLKMVRGVFGVLVILVNTCNLQGPVAFVRLANVLYAGMCYVMLWFVPSFWFVTASCGCWLCSTSLPGGNQVDGLPPAPSNTHARDRSRQHGS